MTRDASKKSSTNAGKANKPKPSADALAAFFDTLRETSSPSSSTSSSLSRKQLTLPGVPADQCPLVHNIIVSVLLYDSDAARTCRMHTKLLNHAIDYNDLRVCNPVEIADILGERYPRSAERSDRLCDILNEIYQREHQHRLFSIEHASKHVAGNYLASLPGMNQFILARALLMLGHTAFPLDDRLRLLLVGAGALDTKVRRAKASDMLETVIPSDQHGATFDLLLAWAETQPFPRLPVTDYTRAMAKKSCRPESKLAKPPAPPPANDLERDPDSSHR